MMQSFCLSDCGCACAFGGGLADRSLLHDAAIIVVETGKGKSRISSDKAIYPVVSAEFSISKNYEK